MNIVRTTEDLVPSVLSVAKATAENNVTEEQRQKFGFLRPYSEAEYIAFTKRADHFYSLLDEGRLIAFFLAHSIDRFDLAGEEVYSHIKNTQEEPFIVARQLAVLPKCTRSGSGRALYEHLRQQAEIGAIREKIAMGFIWKEPHHNYVSEEFNRRMNAREVGTYSLKNGRGLVGIWSIPLTKISG